MGLSESCFAEMLVVFLCAPSYVHPHGVWAKRLRRIVKQYFQGLVESIVAIDRTVVYLNGEWPLRVFCVQVRVSLWDSPWASEG